jgi:hypothetical protein
MVSFKRASTRKTLKHAYEMADAHLYYCTVFSRATLPEEVVTPEIHNIVDLLASTQTELEKLMSQMAEMARQNGVVIGRNFNSQVIDTHAATPYSKKYLALFRIADEYLVIIDSLWIEGILGDDQHIKAGPAMSQICHNVGKRINDIFRRLLAESNKRRNGPAPAVVDEAHKAVPA